MSSPVDTLDDQVFVAAPPRRWPTGVIWIGVAAFLFVAGYLFAVFVLFPPPPVPEDGVAVPDLVGQSLDLARSQLRPLGLEIGDTISVPHQGTAPGLVVAQTPLPGQQLRSGDRVALGLSSGIPAATVPDVVGMGARRAENLLRRLGFAVVQTEESSERQPGTVIRSQPEAGSRQPLPARVQIAVSVGIPDTAQVDTLGLDSLIRRDTVH